MSARRAGRLGLAALLLLGGPALAEPVMQVHDSSGAVLGALPMPAGAEICLNWAHSVTGGAVADCFEQRSLTLVLTRSYLHDFAAGLGDIEGRGRIEPAEGGGYWILDMDEPVADNRLALRVGQAGVDHRLSGPAGHLALSQIAPGARVVLSLDTAQRP